MAESIFLTSLQSDFFSVGACARPRPILPQLEIMFAPNFVVRQRWQRVKEATTHGVAGGGDLRPSWPRTTLAHLSAFGGLPSLHIERGGLGDSSPPPPSFTHMSRTNEKRRRGLLFSAPKLLVCVCGCCHARPVFVIPHVVPAHAVSLLYYSR